MTRKQVVKEFKSGLSPVGIARKYGLTKLQVENAIRWWIKREEAKG